MARDRQRSKQRRGALRRRRRHPARAAAPARRATSGSTTRGRRVRPGRTDARAEPLDTPAAEVDQAELAETGAGATGTGTPRRTTSTRPDESRRRDRASAEAAADAAIVSPTRARERPPRTRARPRAHLPRACVDELKRVQWPDRRHVGQATAVVLGFVLLAGGWLGLMDAIWQPLINAIL